MGSTVAPGARAQRWSALVALVGVAVGTGLGWRLAKDDAEDDAARLADGLVAEASASVENIVGRAVDGLRGANAVVRADGTVDRAAFQAFAAGILDEQSTGIALGLRVDGDERAAFEEAEGIEILERRPGGDLEPAPPAAEHFPVVEIVALDAGTQRLRGFDYGTDPVRRLALDAARDQGALVLTEPVALQPDGEVGIAVIQPLYRSGAAVDGIQERRDAFVGFVVAAYSGADVVGSLVRVMPEGTGFSLVDDGETLYRRGIGADPAALPALARTRSVMVPGRVWDLTVVPADGPSTTAANAILLGGSVAGVALLLLVGVTWRHQRRLRSAVVARLHSQRRSETLEGLAARLSHELSGAEVGEALLGHLPPFTGTTAGAVLVLDDDGQRLDLLAADGYTPEQVELLRHVDLGRPSAMADVVVHAEPRWFTSPLSWRGDAVMSAFGDVGRAAAVVPLLADRSVTGVLILVHPGVRGFYDDERSLLLTVAALAGRAIRRARRYDAEHDAAVVLQRALLPPSLPSFDGASVAVRYLPATGGPAVGGDFYDAFELPGARLGVVVGDVVGRGVRAAAAMGRLRSALRALAEVAPEPEPLVRALEVHVPTIPDALCATMVYVVVDPAAGTLTYVRSGHPPPLVLRASGAAELLDELGSPPLGVTNGDGVRAKVVPFGPGDTLVLYTDGVVERRGEPVTVGLQRLLGVATAGVPDDAEACADRIVEAMLGTGGHGDDAAVVVVRLTPAPAAVEAPVRDEPGVVARHIGG